ncbi:hypothetical protein GIB67_012455 [Kingdonia uniflora]|uniref:Transmembrane protein n=1 Tax=Kingdonia uniflora TaxID=39325 RepID=A0A7J7MVI7_9MAGN|nr:hypothetical protein GIB67_012455 [Kingdonia uniflora]
MHRSASTIRTSEEFYVHGGGGGGGSSHTSDNEELPMYDPVSDFAKKEKLRMKFAENAIHLIPLILVLCAITLWFFSNPEVDMVNKDDSINPRIEGLTIDGDLDVTGSETGLLSSLDLEDFDAPKQMAVQKARRLFMRMFR